MSAADRYWPQPETTRLDDTRHKLWKLSHTELAAFYTKAEMIDRIVTDFTPDQIDSKLENL